MNDIDQLEKYLKSRLERGRDDAGEAEASVVITLIGELREARKDSDRYRWLIDNAEEIYFDNQNLYLDTYHWGSEKVHAEADKAIDFAMSKPNSRDSDTPNA